VGTKVEGQFPAATARVERPGRPREFGRKQQNPVRRFGGIAVVLLLHIVLIYALINGLATKVVQVIQHPIETKIIEPVKPPPPPTITHQAAPVVSAPAVVPPAPPAPPAPTKPVSTEVGVVCPNSDQIRSSIRYPKEAQENNVTGDVLIEFVVDPQGHITNERVAKSAEDSSLDRAAFNAVKQFTCVSQGQAVRVQVPFSFNLN
jgi:protein TonB